MKKNIKILLLGVLAIVVVLGAFKLYGTLVSKNDPLSGVESGDKIAAPDFKVYDKDGNVAKLSDFQGEPVILNFSTSWCPNCKEESPALQAAYDAIGDKVNFLMIDLIGARGETIADGMAYIEENGYTYPAYYDTDQEAAVAYGVSSFPCTFFIDRDGSVLFRNLGPIKESTILSYSKTFYDIEI
ncbi:MAG: TlpA disulfide reductase family protein [Anaerovoracaceae bacterium]